MHVGKPCSSSYKKLLGPNCHRSSALNLKGIILYVKFGFFFFSCRKKLKIIYKGKIYYFLKKIVPGEDTCGVLSMVFMSFCSVQ